MAARKPAAPKPDAAEETTRGRARQRIGQVLNEDEQLEKIRKLIDEVLELKGTAWGYCPNCKKRMTVEVPDLKGRIDGAIKLLEQAEGKPKEDGDAGIVIEVVRPPR